MQNLSIRTKILIVLIIILTCILGYRSIVGSRPGIINKVIETKRFDIEYPQVINLKNIDAQRTINALLYNKAFEHYKLQDFTTEEAKASSFFVRYNITRFSHNIVSVKFDESFMMEHMAHPSNAVKAITLNLSNGKVYTLNDILIGNYAGRINKIIKASIKQRKIPLLARFKGTEKDQEFYLTNDSLVIFFQEYVYTCRAEGPLVIQIPNSKVKDIFKNF